jgi:hypothetical protein
VAGVAKSGGAPKAAPADKGAKLSVRAQGSSSDSVLFEVVSQLEIIQNSTNKA